MKPTPGTGIVLRFGLYLVALLLELESVVVHLTDFCAQQGGGSDSHPGQGNEGGGAAPRRRMDAGAREGSNGLCDEPVSEFSVRKRRKAGRGHVFRFFIKSS